MDESGEERKWRVRGAHPYLPQRNFRSAQMGYWPDMRADRRQSHLINFLLLIHHTSRTMFTNSYMC